ncbi:hypothetical protein GE061_008367 [Apolygus lucorum]|uniref:Uncharacterized protein n=1 Tax=Apolygus lucorum TaxID=248454 RepID=A0A6A4IU43_APOLU|nr:hypothetical protein GE061_008367 [Apolygus lucorum]
MMVLVILSIVVVQSLWLGLNQAAVPIYNFKPYRVKKEECAAVLDPASDPTRCVCNVLLGVPIGAVFTSPSTKGIRVDWKSFKATVHYWKCYPAGATIPSVDYQDVTEPTFDVDYDG